MKPQNIPMAAILAFVVGLIAILAIALGGPLLLSPQQARLFSPELTMSIAIVLTVAVLMALLFAFASAFSALGLANRDHALGLPEGSIRAMIALVLIMVFIILDIYLFRIVGEGTEGVVVVNSSDDIAEISQTADIIHTEELGGAKYAVSFRRPIDEDGTRLAQQVVTTVGTLVVAVAGFYFGSTAVSGATAALRETRTEAVILTVTPPSGATGQPLDIVIEGRGFRMPRAVRLARGNEQIPATNVLASPNRITCTFQLDRPAGGENWDVVVELEDGTEVRLAKAIAITGP